MMLSNRLAGTSRVGTPAFIFPICKPIVARPNAPVVAVRSRVRPSKAQQENGVQGLQGPQTLVLPTLFAKAPGSQEMRKANVILPSSRPHQEGDKVSVKARGVVLFMHGFVQGPTAYARMLTQLATADDVVIVAPCPPFNASADKQQAFMVDHALFWCDLIAKNQLPGLTLLGDTPQHVGLMGHSVGGGLAAYVADAAAKNGQAFSSAHVMAPQTNLVVPEFRFDTADGGTLLQNVDTQWGVQYGLIDLLSNAFAVGKFNEWLRAKGKLKSTVKYELGTHIGFEDQLVVGRESFSTDVLPWVLAVLWGALAIWLPWLGLRGLSKSRGDTNVRAAQQQQAVEGSTPANEGFGVPDDVELPDERVMFAGYVLLAATVTALESAIPGFSWDSLSAGALSVLKGLFVILAIGSWPAVVVYPYEAAKQRPEARRQAVTYFRNMLVPTKAVENVVKARAEVRV